MFGELINAAHKVIFSCGGREVLSSIGYANFGEYRLLLFIAGT